MGRIALIFPMAKHRLSPSVARTVNGPKNLDLSNGIPSPPFSVIELGGRVNGPNCHDLPKGDKSPPCSDLYGGGPLNNVPSLPTVTRTVNVSKNNDHFPSVPTFARTVIGPNSHDLLKGDPSPSSCVVCGLGIQ